MRTPKQSDRVVRVSMTGTAGTTAGAIGDKGTVVHVHRSAEDLSGDPFGLTIEWDAKDTEACYSQPWRQYVLPSRVVTLEDWEADRRERGITEEPAKA